MERARIRGEGPVDGRVGDQRPPRASSAGAPELRGLRTFARVGGSAAGACWSWSRVSGGCCDYDCDLSRSGRRGEPGCPVARRCDDSRRARRPHLRGRGSGRAARPRRTQRVAQHDLGGLRPGHRRGGRRPARLGRRIRRSGRHPLVEPARVAGGRPRHPVDRSDQCAGLPDECFSAGRLRARALGQQRVLRRGLRTARPRARAARSPE